MITDYEKGYQAFWNFSSIRSYLDYYEKFSVSEEFKQGWKDAWAEEDDLVTAYEDSLYQG